MSPEIDEETERLFSEAFDLLMQATDNRCAMTGIEFVEKMRNIMEFREDLFHDVREQLEDLHKRFQELL
jgi:hypothetical protein